MAKEQDKEQISREEITLDRIRIAEQTNSTKLDLSNLQITNLPPEIRRLKNLSSLDLSRNSLPEFPIEIFNLIQIKSLDLSDNKIGFIPESIGQLSNLIELRIGFNGLSSLPQTFSQLTKLEILSLGSRSDEDLTTIESHELMYHAPNFSNSSPNKFKKFPRVIFNLLNLTVLDLSTLTLSSVSPEISKLKRLRILDLWDNNLKSLPREIGLLKKLKFLNININKIAALPAEIGELHSLISLIAFENKLRTIPQSLRRLKNLKHLELKNNLLAIPPEILENSDQPKTILNFYFSLIEVGKKPINEIKLLFVGQGSVGKTSLIQQILQGTFDQNQTKTEGISINQWTIDDGQQTIETSSIVNGQSSVSPSSIKLNIWDFGGQEIMHATHQFFLTKRSLYLLVLDARLTQEENRVEYWLKIIQSFGGESPVLIVGNKTDQHPLDIDRTGLQKKYPNIVGILESSAATGAGIEALKAEIAKQVDTLPHVRDLLPETWFTVKSKLEELGRDKNFITQDEYLGLCATNDVTDETSQHTLIGFLHDLGVVLHFQDDPRLEALGILNPQWVTNGVYKILNSHELFQNQGTLTLPILNKTLNPPEYPRDKRLFIVDMMKKFELCYDIEPDKSFLIPDLLPKDEPFTGEWDDALAFHYHYYVLPTSIISRFIVRMNAFIYKTIWRSGVVLKSGGNTALVKADTEDKNMYIRVSGDENTRRDFLSMIRGELEAIHKTIAKIEAAEKVPLPNYPNADPVDYTFLLQLERDARESFPVSIDGKIVDINVRELLNGIRPSKNQAVKVFISYSHQDKSFAKKLAGELESADMKVWWDFEGLKGGQDWQKEIERGIKQCDFFLVALTPDAVTSEWVGNEITYAALSQKTIIPLHLKKCDIPIGLIKRQWIDFEKQSQKSALKELLEGLKA